MMEPYTDLQHMIELPSVAKEYTRDCHSSLSPQKTVAKAQQQLALLGEYSGTLEEVSHLDTMGLPVYLLHCPSECNESGKGFSEEQCMASALMERVERYSSLSQFREVQTIRSPFTELDQPALSRESFTPLNIHRALYPQGTQDLPIDWVHASSLTTGKKILIPSSQVFLRYKHHFIEYTDSNGLASGNTLTEATLHALLEVVERHLLHIIHYNKPQASQIDLGSVTHPQTKQVIEQLQRKGFTLVANDVSLDWKVSAVSVIVFHKNDQKIFPYNYHIGTATNPEIALLRALTEAAQIRAKSLARRSWKPLQNSFSTDVPDREKGLLEWAQKQTLVSMDDLSCIESDDFKAELDTCIAEIKQKGHEVIAYDLTHPILQLPVARVLVPGLQPNFLLHGFNHVHKFAAVTPYLNCYDEVLKKGEQRELSNQRIEEVHSFE